MTNVLVNDFVTGVLIFVRVVTVMFTAPVFSNRSISVLPKLFLALILSYIILLSINGFHFDINIGFLQLGLLGIKEAITGMLIGFTLNFVFYGLSYAGLLIGFDMGLAVAQMFDPTTESNNNIMGQIILMIAILIFILINGHHYIIRALAYSFTLIPIGYYTINESVFNLLIKYSAGIFVLAIKIASPIMVSFFLLHIGAGIIARVIPQMNVFFVVHPLKIGLGFLLLIFVIPIYVYVIKNLLLGYENKLFELIKLMSY